MTDRLKDKVALITGASRGIGAAAARLFAKEGARVLLADLLDEQGERLAKELTRASDPKAVMYSHLDVTKADQWQAAVAEVERQFGKLNILVNNAGILEMAGLEETSEAVWHRVLDVNQKGAWLGMKTAVPAMRRAGGGSVINLSSVLGTIGCGGATAYQCSKGAVRVLTKQAAAQYGSENIRVNSVHPGAIDTPMSSNPDVLPREAFDAFAAYAPMKRPGTAEEVAYGILFLASDEASFITGSELYIDGGYTAV